MKRRILTSINEKIDDFLDCLFICLLCISFAKGNAYAYKTYEFVWKWAECFAE